MLGELVALGGRWALFKRFVHGRIVEDVEEAGTQKPDVDSQMSGQQTQEGAESESAVVEHSGSQKAIENLLKVYYEPLELWFLRTSIEKAHRLDSADTTSRPYLSSILDDTFYLLKLVLGRAISCGSLPTLVSMRAKISSIVDNDYMDVILKKMEAVYSVPAGTQERGLEKERREREQRQAFTVSAPLVAVPDIRSISMILTSRLTIWSA